MKKGKQVFFLCQMKKGKQREMSTNFFMLIQMKKGEERNMQTIFFMSNKKKVNKQLATILTMKYHLH